MSRPMTTLPQALLVAALVINILLLLIVAEGAVVYGVVQRPYRKQLLLG